MSTKDVNLQTLSDEEIQGLIYAASCALYGRHHEDEDYEEVWESACETLTSASEEVFSAIVANA